MADQVWMLPGDRTRYRCRDERHPLPQEVEALQIRRIVPTWEGCALIFSYPGDRLGASAPWYIVGRPWMAAHKPRAGGYWVRFADGGESFSPADTFENDYVPC